MRQIRLARRLVEFDKKRGRNPWLEREGIMGQDGWIVPEVAARLGVVLRVKTAVGGKHAGLQVAGSEQAAANAPDFLTEVTPGTTLQEVAFQTVRSWMAAEAGKAKGGRRELFSGLRLVGDKEEETRVKEILSKVVVSGMLSQAGAGKDENAQIAALGMVAWDTRMFYLQAVAGDYILISDESPARYDDVIANVRTARFEMRSAADLPETFGQISEQADLRGEEMPDLKTQFTEMEIERLEGMALMAGISLVARG